MRVPSDSAHADDIDEVLYARARRGDLRAFETLYLRYEGRLFGFVLRMVHNHHDAEDLFHEAFVNVLRSREVTFDRASFCTWLYRIARNLSLNHLRDNKRKGQLQQQVPPMQPMQSAEAALEETQRAALLCDALTGLPEQLTEIYKLRSAGMSYEEMAAVLHIPIGTVKSRINRMTLHLREEIFKTANAEQAPSAGDAERPKERLAHGLRGD